MNTGKVLSSNSCGDFRVIKYINYKEVQVEFIATGTIKTVQNRDVTRGAIRDPYYPRVFGVGYLGDYTDRVTGTKQYQTWKGMLERCYCPKFQKQYPTYKGCTVHPDWHHYAVFKEWMDANYIEGYHLDKDFLAQEGNKIYYADTCCFIPNHMNICVSQAKQYSVIFPNGTKGTFWNLSQFCKTHKLHRNGVYRVLTGKLPQTQGYVISHIN